MRNKMTSTEEVRDCRFCNYCMTDSPNSEKCDCYVEDNGYFSRHIENPIKEARECKWFIYCDSFPKL